MSHRVLGGQFYPYKNAAHAKFAEHPKELAAYRAAYQRLGPAQHWPDPGTDPAFDQKASVMHEAAEHLERLTGMHPMDHEV
jgi:hypothetical protein